MIMTGWPLTKEEVLVCIYGAPFVNLLFISLLVVFFRDMFFYL